MARKAKKKASNWKGGSFKAAVGGYIGKRLRKARSRTKRYLISGFKRSLRA